MNTKMEELVRRTVNWAHIQHHASQKDFMGRLPLLLMSVIDAAAADALQHVVTDDLSQVEVLRRSNDLLERSISYVTLL